jgi:IclR family pca regulon transcriptional regulator
MFVWSTCCALKEPTAPHICYLFRVVASRAEPKQQQSLQSLERGIAVLQVFSAERPALSMSEVAQLTGITRATARRILLTLQKLGHVRSDGRLFSLTPRVLTLGWAYLSSLSIWEIARPLMEELAESTKQSCAVAALDLPEVVLVARSPRSSVTSAATGVGTRLPATATCMGRVLLAGLPEREAKSFLSTARLEPYTTHTIVDRKRLARAVATVREQGWVVVDQELEIGLRSIAAPIVDADGSTIAALSVVASVAKVSTADLRTRFLPPLLEATNQVSTSLARRALAQ